MRNRPVAALEREDARSRAYEREDARNRAYTLVRQSILSSVALAGVTSLAFLFGAGPASAATMTACQAKHSECSERCIANNADGGVCIQRTCTHQFKACAAVSGESSNPYHDQAGMKPPRGVRPVVDRSPRPSRPIRPSRPPRGDGSTQLTSQLPSGPAGEVRIPRGGLLDHWGLGGIRQQGPAATGSPMAPAAAPSAPPVIIR
jgi:hypothetical protein